MKNIDKNINKKNILIINGPNINKTGYRNIGQYGKKTYQEINDEITKFCFEKNINIEIYQSNCEGSIVDKIQKISQDLDLLIINPGAYSHYSYAIRDAIADLVEFFKVQTIEVHMSNIYSREEFRQKSVIAPVCAGQISGFGIDSYLLALKYIL